MFQAADRVKETTTTTGTGTLSLAGAATQFQSFISGIGNGNKCQYCILSGNGTDWEVGIGTVTSGSPNTLSRDVILASSNSGSAISLTGTSTVFCDVSAAAFNSLSMALFAPPKQASSFSSTYHQVSGSTFTDTPVGITINSPTNGGNNVLSGLLMAVPTAPYTYLFKLSLITADVAGSTNFGGYGIGWSDGTKAQINLSNGQNLYTASTWSSFNTNVSTLIGPTRTSNNFNVPNPIWFQLEDDSTNISFSRSIDGYNFITDYSIAKSSGYLGASGYSNFVFATDAYNQQSIVSMNSLIRLV